MDGRDDVPLTNLDQPLFDDAQATKRDLVEYVEAVSEQLLSELRDRPLSVVRALRGQRPFMQKNVPKYAPPWVKTVTIWAERARRDAFFVQLARSGDAAVAAHIDRRVAKNARRKHRQRNETAVVLRRERNDLGKGHLGDVEFLMHKKAMEHFLDRQLQHGEIDTRNLRRAVAEVAHMVVRADGETEGELGHVTEDAWRVQSTRMPVVFTILPYLS